jgi:hypothetical protein
VIESEREAQQTLLKRLEKKYDEQFVLVKAEEPRVIADDWMNYVATFAPVIDKDKTFLAEISTGGAWADDYGKYIFKDEVEGYCLDICKEKDYLVRYEVELVMSTTSRRWTEKDSLEDFLGTEKTSWDPWDEMRVWLELGLTDEQYAVQIKDLMDELYDLPCVVMVRVYDEGVEIFVAKLTGIDYRHFTIEEIESEIETSRLSDAYYKNKRAEEAAAEDSSQDTGTTNPSKEP